MYCDGYSQSDLWRVMKLEHYGMGDSAELIIGNETEATMGFQRVTFEPDILFRGNLTYTDGVTVPNPDAGNITCNAININGVSMLNSKFKLGSDTYYISEYGTGKFSTIYEGGTALSDKYLSNSQLKSCLVTDSNSKSISCSSNGGTGSTTVSMTKNGYTLLGCVGIEVSGTASTLCNIVEFSVSGSGIYVRYRNMHETSSSQTDTWTLTTYGLYIKN